MMTGNVYGEGRHNLLRWVTGYTVMTYALIGGRVWWACPTKWPRRILGKKLLQNVTGRSGTS